MANTPEQPILYGAAWCPKSANLRNYLQSAWVDFTDRDVEADTAAAERVKAQFEGHLKFPVIEIGGEWLVNPKPDVLRAKLQEKGLL